MVFIEVTAYTNQKTESGKNAKISNKININLDKVSLISDASEVGEKNETIIILDNKDQLWIKENRETIMNKILKGEHFGR